MLGEDIKAIARREAEEIESQGNYLLVDELMAPDYRLYCPGFPPLDREGFKELLSIFRTGFPDLSVRIEDQVADGNRVINRVIVRGTHKGFFCGIPPTGRCVEVSSLNTMRVEGGRLVAHWDAFDLASLMPQLGVGAGLAAG